MKAFVLTLKQTPNRLIQFLDHFDLPYFIKPVYSDPHENRVYSFNCGYIKMLQAFLDTGEQRGILFEDDADLLPVSLEKIIREECPYFDLLYLGGNMCHWVPEIELYPPTWHSEHTVRIYRALTTHAIIWTRKAAEAVVAVYDPSGMPFDLWLSRYFLPNNHCFMIHPMIARQRPGFSMLEDKETNHTNSFDETDLLCKSAKKV